LMSGSRNVVVLDTLDSDSCNAADVVLPTSSFAECEGTLVNMEGRAQRHYPVFEPSGKSKPATEWLRLLGRASRCRSVAVWAHFDEITLACANAVPRLKGICEAAPPAEYRSLGQKIPRQPHRYSGRTAMRANVSVHEPKQTVDGDTPLAYTMEGHSGDQPGSLLTHVWSPGWNSNQSLHKFQSSVGGPLRGGTAGHRLLDDGCDFSTEESSVADTTALAEGQYRLVAMYRIFGSDEQSVHSAGISELCRPASIAITSAIATTLGVSDGDGITVQGDTCSVDLLVEINDTMAATCVGFSSGVDGTAGLTAGEAVGLRRAENWQRPPQLIGTDRGSSS
jgi:NADH-quinone oxidoreductase subunit G